MKKTITIEEASQLEKAVSIIRSCPAINIDIANEINSNYQNLKSSKAWLQI